MEDFHHSQDATLPSVMENSAGTPDTSCDGSLGGNSSDSNSGIVAVLNHEYAGKTSDDYTGVFEGPEKTLEVCFRPIITTSDEVEKDGLRRLVKSELDQICSKARCTILSSISNAHADAYVLSESSLFIYSYMLVLKTCGTTTLLRTISTIVELARKVNLEISWVGYSRKNFNFPHDQLYPHESFHQELAYLADHKRLAANLNGNGYTLGPLTGDHWFVFVADKMIRNLRNSTVSSSAGVNLDFDNDRVLNIMMFDMDESVSEKFYYEKYHELLNSHEGSDFSYGSLIGDIKVETLGKNGGNSKLYETFEEEKSMCSEALSKAEEARLISHLMTTHTGISALCPGSIIDPKAFEPCGYSMNALLFNSYATIHVTPEAGSSYASFETNQKVKTYGPLIRNVIRTFKPKRFVLTMMADEKAMKEVKDLPLLNYNEGNNFAVPLTKEENRARASFTNCPQFHYKRKNLANIQVEDDCVCMMGNFVLDEDDEGDKLDMGKMRIRARPRGVSDAGIF